MPVRNGWPGAQAAYDYLWPFIGDTSTGCVSLDAFPVASQYLGRCPPLRWQSRALVEPYRSRTP